MVISQFESTACAVTSSRRTASFEQSPKAYRRSFARVSKDYVASQSIKVIRNRLESYSGCRTHTGEARFALNDF